MASRTSAPFPMSAGILLGIGLGGFFDGIVLHQILQWHHMVSSAGFPPDSVRNLEINTLLDGLFHASTYVFVVAGIVILWRRAHLRHISWSTKALLGSMLMGFGFFNVVEGIANHHLLGLHHVNETVPPDQWLYWDLAFLIWGLGMIGAGWMLKRAAGEAIPGVPQGMHDRRRTPEMPLAGGRRRTDPHSPQAV